MRRLVLAAALLLLASGCARDRLTVMSFNVRYPAPTDGGNRWEQRRELFVRAIRRAHPDVIGTQELFQLQGDYLTGKLPRYAWFGRDRRGGHGDEHMGIFYRRDRLKLLRFGDFWLSDTPETVGSISWSHPLPRMVNWGEFADRAGHRFFLFDTHLPYRDEDEDARGKGAALIAERVRAIAGDAPVILTGDFNTVPTSRAHQILSRGLTDAWDSGAKRTGPTATFHNFTGTPDRRIDWIFTRGVGVRSIETVTYNDRGRYPSDHFPVVATVTWR